MKNKQTAIQWLIEELKREEYLGTFCTPEYWPEEERKMRSIIEQAKEIEKEQIMEAYDSGLFDGTMDIVKDRMYKKYYNETYGGNNLAEPR